MRTWTVLKSLSFGVACAILVGCDGREDFHSPLPVKTELDKARAVYQAKSYEKSRELFEALIARGVKTGDVFFYHAFSMYAMKVSNDEVATMIASYEAATNWFGRYRSEYPEDRNDQKAIYNLGIVFFDAYRRNLEVSNYSREELRKVKAVWDAGGGKHGKNEFIKAQYERLENAARHLDLEEKAREVREAVEQSPEAFQSTFATHREAFEKADLETLKKNGAMPSRLLVTLVDEAKGKTADASKIRGN